MNKQAKEYELNLKENPLTDEDLMLLEQLCYLDKEVCNAAGLKKGIVYSSNINVTIGEILSSFKDENLDNLLFSTLNDAPFFTLNGAVSA